MDMDMDSRSQGVVVNALGFLYASLGFSLSVLGALLNALYRGGGTPQEVSPLPSQLRVPKAKRQPLRLVRSFSDQSPTTTKQSTPKRKVSRTPKSGSPSSVEKVSEKHGAELSMEKDVAKNEKPKSKSASLHSHRRSRSMVPIITIDFIGSTESLRPNSADFLKIEPRIKSTVVPLPQPQPILTTTINQPASPTSTSSSGSTSTCPITEKEKPTFRLFGNIKQWGKDKPKGVSLKRSRSSPQLCHAPPGLPTVVCHRQAGSDGTLKDLPVKVESQTPKTHKTLRKMSSGPAREKNTPPKSAESSPARTTEKKRSQTLRTHPYEAPYFAPPPVPPLPRNLQARPSSSKSLDKMPSNPQLAKS